MTGALCRGVSVCVCVCVWFSPYREWFRVTERCGPPGAVCGRGCGGKQILNKLWSCEMCPISAEDTNWRKERVSDVIIRFLHGRLVAFLPGALV